MASLKDRIKEFILSKKGVDSAQVDRLFKDSRTVEQFKRSLQERGILQEEEYCSFLSKELGLAYLDLNSFKFDKSNADIISQQLALQYKVFPVSKANNIITLATADPLDILVLDDLRFKLSSDIEMVLSPASQINQALSRLYKEEEKEERFLDLLDDKSLEDASVVEEGSESKGGYDMVAEGSKPPIVRVVDLVVTEALNRRASDIHIEPEEERVRVRYRVDGVLHEIFILPKKNQNAIVARLKIMSGLNITETRIPQDGRFKVRLGRKEVDFRVSSLPTKYGEKFVLRALDKSNLSIGLSKLGFSAGPQELFEKALERPFGIILVTGPTGSGKSTTLYSIVNDLNTPERNMITIEEPVEYQVEGISQIQVNSEIGLSFASCLRAVLRQSPDVIMVGEIRDSETADIAIKASLTGELILSTLHTNDSVGAISRLIDMGIEPFLLASSLIITSAQRLCRKTCPKCRTSYKVSKKVLDKLGLRDENLEFYVGKGCDYCGGTGYHGREAILEVLLVDDKIRNMITKRANEDTIIKYARENLKFKTLREDALDKCFQGITTLEEVFRVT
ncbi:MAG: type II/IV secretion system protein [Candidatus Omnitrophica bacterium]|nr:type II/IV secretion system protein [Candidatus Omnitrophota bacterium]